MIAEPVTTPLVESLQGTERYGAAGGKQRGDVAVFAAVLLYDVFVYTLVDFEIALH